MVRRQDSPSFTKAMSLLLLLLHSPIDSVAVFSFQLLANVDRDAHGGSRSARPPRRQDLLSIHHPLAERRRIVFTVDAHRSINQC